MLYIFNSSLAIWLFNIEEILKVVGPLIDTGEGDVLGLGFSH